MQDVVCYLLGRAGFDRAAQGMLGAGRRLADGLGGKLRALVLGPADDALIAGAQAVADSVVLVEDALLGEYHPENFLNALTAACKSLEPRRSCSINGRFWIKRLQASCAVATSRLASACAL